MFIHMCTSPQGEGRGEGASRAREATPTCPPRRPIIPGHHRRFGEQPDVHVAVPFPLVEHEQSMRGHSLILLHLVRLSCECPLDRENFAIRRPPRPPATVM